MTAQNDHIVTAVLDTLRAERAKIAAAIESLEASLTTKLEARRGLTSVKKAKWSPERRAQKGREMKAFWKKWRTQRKAA